MPEINIEAEACRCKHGVCESYVEPPEHCVNRLARKGRVYTKYCEGHGATSWHYEDKCLICERSML